MGITLWLTDIFSKWEYFEENEMLDDEGYFFNTKSAIMKDTGISERKQTEYIKKLREMGVLKTKLAGIPARYYYKIDINELGKLVENCNSSDVKNAQQGSEG